MANKGIRVDRMLEVLKGLPSNLIVTTTASDILVLRKDGQMVPVGFIDLEMGKLYESREIK
jgi:hypothetical protein